MHAHSRILGKTSGMPFRDVMPRPASNSGRRRAKKLTPFPFSSSSLARPLVVAAKPPVTNDGYPVQPRGGGGIDCMDGPRP